MTIASMLVAVAVVGVGLFIVGFGDGSWRRLLAGGVIVGVGVAAMHYLGMAAMSMTGLDVLQHAAAGALGADRDRGRHRPRCGRAPGSAAWRATIGAALIMGVAVSGMHYTGMAALHDRPAALMPSMAAMATSGGMPSVSGTTAAVFLIPLLLVISIATFAVTLTISMSPGEDEIEADAEMRAPDGVPPAAPRVEPGVKRAGFGTAMGRSG